MKSPKVICLGFQKTGTTSLRRALDMLGYTTGGYGEFRDMAKTPGVTREDLWARAKNYLETRFDAVQDTPWPVLFREIDAAFPGSKFILVIRDTEKWWRSAEGDFGGEPNELHRLIYGVPVATGHETVWKNRYEKHNADVIAHFAGRPDQLLVMHLDRGEVGWTRLAAFLGVEAPEAPWPHVNTQADKRRMLFWARVRERLGMSKRG